MNSAKYATEDRVLKEYFTIQVSKLRKQETFIHIFKYYVEIRVDLVSKILEMELVNV
jgi:hypothetical protein